MFEIELKAWVHDRDALIQRLHKVARFAKKVLKNDTYYHIPSQKDGKVISVRHRTEIEISGETKKQRDIITYKRKEKKTGGNGIETELNEEKECEISSFEPLEALFKDAGFAPYLTKQKVVEDYTTSTPYGNATLELCDVEELGNFIEIEILSKTNDGKTVSGIQKELKALLAKCGIPEADIENRYYSELLTQKLTTEIKMIK